MKNILLIFAAIFSITISGFAQNKVKDAAAKSPDFVRSSPAYAEILLRRTELEAELESLIPDYTEDFPRIQEIRFIVSAIKNESARLFAVKVEEQSRLTLALGKLIIRKVESETDLWRLSQSYKEEHPDVRRAKRRVEIFENAIKEILGG